MNRKTLKIIFSILVCMSIMFIANNSFAINIIQENATPPGEMMDASKNFLQVGQDAASKENSQIDDNSIKSVSDTIFSTLYAIAIGVLVITGTVLGIKYMLDGVEGKAKIKETLVPYTIGAIVIFSAYPIWKLAILIFRGL